jgi:ribonuclease G
MRDERRRDEEKQKPRKTARIEELLKVGQEVLVQISKDTIGTKGARLTSHISIPGRHLVFMPTVDHVGISRRISNEKERKRLREIVERMRPPGTGFIVRTVAENVPQEKLESDIRFLIEVWNQVVRRNEKRGGPGLMHPDLDLILRATRDLFAQDVEKLVVDDRDEYERILGFVTAQDPALRDRVICHDNEEPVFDAYGIEQEIHRALQRKVWLKSGGYLIMDQAEALTAIDVNSGRYVGKKSLEETITKINVEAAKEIVYQLRLRNIGGIIICDFIDLEKPQNRDKVFKALQEALGRDKAKTNVLRISELGLIEMTRKRVRESIGRTLHEDCSYCDGKGFVKTATTVCYDIFRDIRREAPAYKEQALVINCHGDVARLLQGEERQELRHLMDRYNKSIQVRAQQNYHREQYDVYGRSAQGSDQRVASSPPMGGEQRGGGASGGGGGGGRHDGPRGESGRGRGNYERGGGRDKDREGGRDHHHHRDREHGRDRRDRDHHHRGGDRGKHGGGQRGGQSHAQESTANRPSQAEPAASTASAAPAAEPPGWEASSAPTEAPNPAPTKSE